jgi:hypothetical protein
MTKGSLKVSQKSKEKIPITFNSEQIRLIEEHTGVMGNTKAEIIRNIVINWLLERGDKK